MEAINGRSQVIAAGAALSAFRGASQHNWIMRLDFPFADGPTAILLPNKLFFHKAVSCCFRDVLKVLSDDPRVPLKIVMGKIVTVSLVWEDGTLRSERRHSPAFLSLVCSLIC
jgi:type VI secretion system secreted protein VgrG